jgi:hypothetical protein
MENNRERRIIVWEWVSAANWLRVHGIGLRMGTRTTQPDAMPPLHPPWSRFAAWYMHDRMTPLTSDYWLV